MTHLITFLFLLLLWIIFSGLFDAWHFGLGIVSCGLVTYLSRSFLTSRWRRKDILFIPRFILYVPWLLYQITLANIYMAYIVLHPRMEKVIYPHIVKFKTRIRGDLGLTTFANSITLTPGTITILIEEDVFYVHAINEKVANSLPGEMEERVKKIFEV